MDRSGEELTRLCAYCDRESTSVCRRCGVSLCRIHTPRDDRRCDECEGEYRADRSKRAAVHAAATGAVVTGLLGLVLLFALPTGGGALALAPLILFCAVPVTLFKLELRSRTRFLSETGAKQLPEARLLTRSFSSADRTC